MAAKKKSPARKARLAAKKSVRKTAPAKKQAFMRIGAHSDFYGGRYEGIVRGENGQPDYHIYLLTGKEAAKVRGQYGPTIDITGETSEFDGMANTQAMAAAGSDLAKKALAFKFKKRSDYYIASRREARIIASNDPDAIKDWAWTSTQNRARSDCAWVQYFGNGYQLNNHKSDEFPAVLVRRQVIQ